ncbi:hypothetical protein DVK85_09515 [Flavobacterium arcticum]|uniref:Uncharacterized protein n=2 Tax=Flavobacterium arcticum TaxID=1784713 RepID=A0A345HCZ9_9FLAO|nr:hypothetical protein DVK85_09515 [Flavobacterium arcticum]
MGAMAIFFIEGLYIKTFNIVGHLTITVLSMPISFIDRSYPFYAPVPPYQAILLLMLNVAIHAGIAVFIIKTTKKNKS